MPAAFINLYDRADYETELEPLCLEKGVGVIPYILLASGFLTGKYRSEKDLANRPRGEMVKKYLNEQGFRILDALEQVASQYHSAPAIVSLAWLIARPSITAPIASATSLDQLSDLIEATKLTLNPLFHRAAQSGKRVTTWPINPPTKKHGRSLRIT